ncbi:MAG: hypothetical protein WB715_19400 [Roseiarcus sp.]|uniref:hypothetical protein n=1 Tax=Roseiarcus sp. TaxID=1969460 RepID=UPI003C4ACEA1
MSQRLHKLLDERQWSRADLTRAAAKFMPEDGRFGPDNTSNFVNGKRCPTKPFLIAMCKAFGVDEDAILPPYLRERPGENAAQIPLLAEVPGKLGLFRLYLDRELALKDALKIIQAIDAIGTQNN